MKKKLIFILVPVILIMIAAGVWLVMHEKNQSENIVTLLAANEDLGAKVDRLTIDIRVAERHTVIRTAVRKDFRKSL